MQMHLELLNKATMNWLVRHAILLFSRAILLFCLVLHVNIQKFFIN